MKYRGFTLIELVIVIIILGILSAVALPRFLDLSNDARRAVNQGVVGGLAGSVASWYGKVQLPAGHISTVNASVYGPIKAFEINPPDGPGYLLFASNNYPVGGDIVATKTGSPAAYTISSTLILAEATDYQAACNGIFNGLLSDNSIRASTTTADAATYLTLNSGAIVSGATILPSATAPDGGTWSARLADNSDLNNVVLGTCLWQRIDTPNFYIYYDQKTGSFTSVEVSN